jgi:hypothetical protein
MYKYIQCMYMVSPVVSTGFQKMVNFVQTCLYCVHTYVNIHERVGTMYIQICYIMNMYVHPIYIYIYIYIYIFMFM